MTANTLHSTSSPSITPALDASFAAINWQAPWLHHISQLDYLSQRVAALSQSTNSLGDVAVTLKDSASHSHTFIADLLNTAMTQKTVEYQNQPQTKPMQDNHAHPLKFVSQDALPEGEAYESFIATTGHIPTRENLHDLFNGSIWLTFPKTKALLNYHHMCEISEQGIGASRGRVRDTITVFDENGAILVTAVPSIGEALIDFNWQESLVSTRDEWDKPLAPNENAQVAVYIFGHALLEQLIQPRKSLCAHSVVIQVTQDFFALALPERMSYVDNRLAEQMHTLLSQEAITPRQLAPLPILGVPHFWADNANPDFYEDSRVFRSGRRRKS
ncbi:DUF3025 domain-containing protein [Psychrobacter frigidicola]|uniref:DUF3025 domain-containing protein n=1 Tax=Psychrobacter frigidicola TaxID=45611 RepID=A0A5C7A638_9GAMM|nr:DUF3025 domain-containing protein [Psychrobacter frigidicola]TXD96249.1 DUF3025 domain-containing protein [Psychrobacter frigidicola]